MRDLLLNNFWWKFTALLLAVLVWGGFQPKEKRWKPPAFPSSFRGFYTRYLVAHPVTISKPATDTREFKVSPSQVDVTLSGDEKILRDLRSSQVRMTVDVSEFKGQTNVLPIEPSFPKEGGIKVERITPPEVQVELVKE